MIMFPLRRSKHAKAKTKSANYWDKKKTHRQMEKRSHAINQHYAKTH